MADKKQYDSIASYIEAFPEDTRVLLEQLYKLIAQTAIEAEERISYQMPTFYFYGNLVHFAGYQNHIGFYPTPSAIEAFQDELAEYKTSKGTIQFPLYEPLPDALIKKIVAYRVDENTRHYQEKIANKIK